MSYVPAVAFGLVVGAVALGVDYVSQSRNSPGAFGPADYIASVGDRFGEVRESAAQATGQTELARAHLPEPPAGWVRVAWTPEYEALMSPPRELQDFEKELMDELGSNAATKGLVAAGSGATERRMARTTWVYKKGRELVFLSAEYRTPQEAKGRSGAALAFVAANLSSMASATGFGVIKGVTYQETTRPSGPDEDDAARRRFISATMGNAIEIRAEARARDTSVRTLLDAIDYDALNAMLPSPLTGVGSDAPEMTIEQEQFVANMTVRAKQRMEPAQRQAAEAQMMEAFQPSAMEKVLMGAVGGAPAELVTKGADGRPRKVDALIDESLGRATRDLQKMTEKAGTRPARAEAEATTGQPIDVAGLHVTYDGRNAAAEEEWKLYQSGLMETDHPGYAVRRMEVERGLPWGSCLQVDTGKVLCNANADRMRQQAAAEAPRPAPEQAAAKPRKIEVKVNRGADGSKRATGGCGAGTFCKADN